MQMAGLFTLMVGLGATVTVEVAVLVHVLASVPLTVYTVLKEELAVTVLPEVALSPPAGDHEYVFAPFAVSVMLLPAQIVPLFTVTIGSAFTRTEVVAVFTHPFASVPVTVYAVVEEGVALTDDPEEVFKPVEGNHA